MAEKGSPASERCCAIGAVICTKTRPMLCSNSFMTNCVGRRIVFYKKSAADTRSKDGAADPLDFEHGPRYNRNDGTVNSVFVEISPAVISVKFVAEIDIREILVRVCIAEADKTVFIGLSNRVCHPAVAGERFSLREGYMFLSVHSASRSALNCC